MFWTALCYKSMLPVIASPAILSQAILSYAISYVVRDYREADD